LVVLVTAVLAESMRVSFPLLTDYADNIGFTTAAAVIPALFAITLLAGPLGALAGPRALLVVGVGGLAVGRAIMQVQYTPALAVTLMTVFTGFVALTAALRVSAARTGPLTTASAIFLGLALDTAIRLALTTWDPAWQNDPFSWSVGLALPAALTLILVGVTRDRASTDWGADTWGWAILPGLVLALQMLILANPGYVAASAELGLATAGAIILVGLGLAAATPAQRGPGVWLAWAVLIAVAVLLSGPTGVSGWPVPIGILAGQVAIGALVATTAVRAAQAGTVRTAWRTGFGAGLSALALVAVLLPYQISYDLDLLKDVPQLLWPTVAAILIVAIGRSAPKDAEIRPPRVSRLRWAAAIGPIPLLAVPSWLALTWPDVTEHDPATTSARVATYNLHYSIDEHGRLDPAQTAEVLSDGGAEIILLQEVVRGWPIGGGLDAASWMSRHLGMEFVYGQAAENRFGNAVMADRPILTTWSDTMDRGEGPMTRGYVGASVGFGTTTLDVWSTHLQHRDDTTATRHAQARQILDAWDDAERTIIGGDLNAAPGEPDLDPWLESGLVSAQEATPGEPRPTAPARDPVREIDWILGSPDLRFVAAEVVDTMASDHLPVFATVRWE
jgi:endonuclease/exonuclease/phosphatase family metal-dependent hydrolase